MKKIFHRFTAYKIQNKKMKLNEKVDFAIYAANTLILTINIIYLYPFFVFNKFMFYIDLLAVGTTLLYFKLIEEKKYRLYSYIIITKISIFLSCAVLLLGWNTNFHYYIFLSLVIYYLPFYLKDNIRVTHGRRILMVLGLCFLYIFLQQMSNKIVLSFATRVPENIANIFSYFNFLAVATSITSFSYFYSQVITSEKEELSKRADYDQLTGLYNRYIINKSIDFNKKLISEGALDKNEFLIAMLDIDHFKNINDTYGHDTGDYILKKISKELMKFSKVGVLPGRWGGEEFLLISSSMSEDEFRKELEKFRIKIYKDRFLYHGKKIKVTISIGLAKYQKGLKNDELVKLADEKLYIAKETGRNRLVG